MPKILFALLLLATGLCTHAASQTYTYETVNYPGAVATFLNAMNEDGIAVGDYVDSNIRTHGFTYANNTFNSVDLGSPAEGNTYLTSINKLGEVIGNFAQSSGDFLVTSYLIVPGGRVDPLVTSPIGGNEVIAINYAQHTLGITNSLPGLPQGFLVEKGTTTLLSYPPAAFNNFSEVVGCTCPNFPTSSQGFYYFNGQYTKVSYPGQPATFLSGINDLEVMVGSYWVTNQGYSAFIYNAGSFTPFTVPNTVANMPTGITNSGVIYGWSWGPNNSEPSFIATPVR